MLEVIKSIFLGGFFILLPLVVIATSIDFKWTIQNMTYDENRN